MSRFWIAVHRMAINPYFQGVVGLLIAFSGLWEFINFDPEEGEFYMLQGFHAVMLLGVFHFLVALEHLLYGLKLTGLAVIESTGQQANRISKKVCCVVENPFFEIFLAALILSAGIIEVWEDMSGADPTMDDGIWQYGLLLLGLFGMVRAIAGLIKSLMLIKMAEEEKGWHLRFIDLVDRIVRKPIIEIVVAVILISMGFFEEIWFEAVEQDGVFIEGHQGMMLYGLHQIAQHLPSLFVSVQVLDDAGQNNRSH